MRIESVAKRIRARGRNWFFHTLRRTFETDDGREIAVDALQGLVSRRPRLPATALDLEPPYDDLRGRARPRDYAGTVFITARFRTGSTLLWNIFRHGKGCRSYYEPLNERRWFDPAARGSKIDPTHRGVDDYWREYDGLTELGQWHRRDWTTRSLFMDESSWDTGLQQYFDRLIARAQPDRAVLQCNRIDFRLPWLHRQFPGASFVHLYRHPRDQWCSSLMTPAAVPRTITIKDFSPHDHFYLQSWGIDLKRHFPFLPIDAETPPYLLFYFIWKLSYLYGAASADLSISFEDLVSRPAQVIGRLVEELGIDSDPGELARLVTATPFGQWRGYADDAWFRPHEERADRIVAEFFRDGDYLAQTETGARTRNSGAFTSTSIV